MCQQAQAVADRGFVGVGEMRETEVAVFSPGDSCPDEAASLVSAYAVTDGEFTHDHQAAAVFPVGVFDKARAAGRAVVGDPYLYRSR